MIQRIIVRSSRAVGSLKSTRAPSSQSPLLAALRSSPKGLPSFSSHTPFLTHFQPRCYSTTPQAKAPVSNEALATDESTEPPLPAEDSLQKELDTKGKEIIDLKDKYLRSVADFRNLQERTKRDIQSARDYAITRFAKDLIESVDNLDRALSTVPAEALQETVGPSSASTDKPIIPPNQDLMNLYSGLKMTEQILMSTLKKHGLERFDPSEKEESFNPNLHEATFQTKVEGKTDGTVFNTQQKGFLLNGRVVRAAKVGVVKNS